MSLKTNYWQSCVINFETYFIPFFSLSFFFFPPPQTELKLWRMEDQPLAVQLAAVIKVL